ncbi:MAG: nicotinamide riboside transporter PnuC [bacterium]|nr:nicotinamide riboside transporter PnuC [bacterium]
MINIKLGRWKKIEIIIYFAIVLAIIINAIIAKDYWVAVVASICGITYSALAGKGVPLCYLFSITSAGFYSLLAYQNALWGNLLLNAGYYIPMYIWGYIQWKKNLSESDGTEIIKDRLSNITRLKMLGIATIIIIISSIILYKFHGSHPILDSITTIISLFGMYYTVKRCIEQWMAWMIVNSLSLLMWIKIMIDGAKAYSTIAMWAVYLFFAIYFYIQWDKEIKLNKNSK